MGSLCNLQIQQFVIVSIILIIIFMYFYNKKENIDDNKTKKTSEMYIPNCNMLNDEKVCSNTNGCYYKFGCRYDWSKLQTCKMECTV